MPPGETSFTAPLTLREICVCRNVGARLARSEIDAETALRWLQGWAHQHVGGEQ